MDKNTLLVINKIQDDVKDVDGENGLSKLFSPYSNRPLMDVDIVIPMVSDRSFAVAICDDFSSFFTIIDNTAYKIVLNTEHIKWYVNGMQLRKDGL